jgi:uncharacterized small protein (DUF1192 family)
MRIHKTIYATLTVDELLKEADRQGFNASGLGLEFMERLEYMQEEVERLRAEVEPIDH